MAKMCCNQFNRKYRIAFFVFAVGCFLNPPGKIAIGQEPPGKDDTTQPKQVDGITSGENKNQTPEPIIDEGDAAANRKAVIDRLVGEIANLTPGNLKEPIELRAGVEASIGLLLDNKLDEARKSMEALTIQYPDLPPVDLQLAAIFFATNNAAEGGKLLEDAATVYPELPTVYNAFARIAIAQQRKTDALALLEKSKQVIASKTWSEQQKSHFELSYLDAMADLMIIRRDFGNARMYLDQVTSRRPDDSRNVMRLAEVDFAQEKIDQCLQRLVELRKLVPESRVPELLMATLYSANGKLPEADVWVEKARRAYGENTDVLIEFAAWMVNRERFEDAESALKKVDELKPDMLETKLLRGKIAFASKEYTTAEDLFGGLRVLEPGNAEIANLWAMSLAESPGSSKLAKALEVAGQNAQLQPQNPVPMAILGWVFFKQNNLPKSQEWMERAAQSRNLTPEVAFYFAKLLHQLGDSNRALQLTTGALQQPGLFLYRTTAQEFRKELLSRDEGLSAPKK